MDIRLFLIVLAFMTVFTIGVVRHKPIDAKFSLKPANEIVIEATEEDLKLAAKIELLLLLGQEKWQEDRYETTMYGPNDCDKKPDHPLYRITASGKKVREKITVAASPTIPFGTLVMIDGFSGNVYVIEDRGGSIEKGKGKWPDLDKIDIFVEDEAEAIEFGRKQKIAYMLYPENQTEEIRRAFQKYLKLNHL